LATTALELCDDDVPLQTFVIDFAEANADYIAAFEFGEQVAGARDDDHDA
jgi:hypothetical protein